MGSNATHPHLRNPDNLTPGQEMLRCQTGSACFCGLKPNPIDHIVHHDENVSVPLVPSRPSSPGPARSLQHGDGRSGSLRPAWCRAPSPQADEAPSAPLQEPMQWRHCLTNSATCSSMQNQQQYSDSRCRVATAPRWSAFFM